MELVYKLAETNEEIKSWVENKGGKPAIVDDPSIVNDTKGLRIDWPGEKDETMLSGTREQTRDISWEEFFGFMERHHLGFMYSEDAKGVSLTSQYKFVNKDLTSSQ